MSILQVYNNNNNNKNNNYNRGGQDLIFQIHVTAPNMKISIDKFPTSTAIIMSPKELEVSNVVFDCETQTFSQEENSWIA